MTIEQLKLKLFKELKVEMNGAVVSSMKDHGTDYHLTYGVAVATIKKVAQPYYPNHDLAAVLLGQDVRELRLSAVFIDDPKMLDKGSMHLWAGVFTTVEMVEQSTMNLLWHSPIAYEMSCVWIKDQRPLYVKAAAMIMGRIAGAKLITVKQMQDFLPLISEVASMKDFSVKNGVIYALREMAISSDDMKKHVEQFLKTLHDLRTPDARDIAYDVEWQIK